MRRVNFILFAYIIPFLLHENVWAQQQELTCVACNDGFYLDDTDMATGGDPVCRRCPVNMFTTLERNATDQTDCLCNPGWTNGLSVCEACEVGLYKPSLGNTTCVECPAFSKTLGQNSTTLNECLCIEGYTVTDSSNPHVCAPCTPGSFKEILGDESCLVCPPDKYCIGTTVIPANCTQHSSSPAGSDEVFDCSCGAGFFAIFVQDIGGVWRHVCEECPTGTYNNLTNQSTCFACPEDTFLETTGATQISACQACDPNADSLPGSTSQLQCQCRVGYAGEPGNACEACPPGYFQESNTNHICEPCPANTYNGLAASDSIEACLSCPSNTTSVASSSTLVDCVCEPGFSSQLVPGSHHICTQCLQGFYQTEINQTECIACSQGKFSTASGAISEATCQTCQDGFVALLPGSTFCTPCASNYFQDLTDENRHAVSCLACPLHSTHNITASTDITQCRCDPGYAEFSNPHRCEVCQAGYYCPGDGEQILCPFNHYSTSGSIQCTLCANRSQALEPNIVFQNECKCIVGTEGTYDANCTLCLPGKFQALPDNGFCSVCPSGTFASGRGNTECSICPGNSTSSPSSEAITDCSCLPGFFGIDGQSCTVCPPNKVCLGGNNQINCKLHSTGPSNSDDTNNCICNAGYYSVNQSAPCQSCPPGFYCSGGTAKVQCPHNSTSYPRSSSVEECICIPGHWRNCILDHDTENYIDASGQSCTIIHAQACVECGPNVICNNNTLEHCPDNSVADAGSALPHHCICEPGFKTVVSS